MFQTYENPQSDSPAENISMDAKTIRSAVRAIDEAMCLLTGVKEKLIRKIQERALPNSKFIIAEATDSPETQIRCRVVRAEDLNTDFALTPSPSTAQDRRLADPRRNGKIPPDSTV